MEPSEASKPLSNIIQCQLCPYNTLRMPFLDKHMEQKHGFAKVVPKEERTAKKRGRKKKLEPENTDHELEFMCKMCKYKSGSLPSLKLHMSVHVEYYKCTECNFQTVNVNDLKTHENSHKSVEIFHCANCDYSCRIKTSLRKHMKIHQPPAGVPCGFCDNYKAHHKSYLYKHIKLHHNGTRTIYECDQCDYHTPTKSHLKQHKQKHFPKKLMFECDICEFRTNIEHTMTKHRDNCGDEMIIKEIDDMNQVWFCCDRCEFKAKDQRHVTSHKKNHVKADEINRRGREIFYQKQKDIEVEEEDMS